MYPGLVTYGGEESGSEHEASSPVQDLDRSTLNLNVKNGGEARVTIVKRSNPNKATIRARTRSPSPVFEEKVPSTSKPPEHSLSESPSDELTEIRRLLKPPAIPSVEDYGIPPAPDTEPSASLQAKLAQFRTLKTTQDKHFNDALMANRSFRNPHLYATLVEFVDVDETASNFPPELWDPKDVRPEWYADKIAERQKARAEQHAASQAPGKRSNIAFTSSSSSSRERGKDRYKPYDRSGRR
ncbi:HCNGP-domain-containing protein [Auricularia subglabra TFB-10046 SS5]|nr:HCNGP-domain-containing protein [Auricularia subglabra TFB-10046 SS5]